jgi:Flp pilus assembly protein TadD
VVLALLDRLDEALVAYNESLALEPNSSKAWSDKAIVLRALGRPAEAQNAKRRAKELGG